MAVNRDTLRALSQQRSLVDQALAAGDQELIAAWARLWDQLSAELDEVTADIASGNGMVSRLVRRRKQSQALRVAASAMRQAVATLGAAITPQAERLIQQAIGDAEELISTQLPDGASGMGINLNRVDPGQIDAIVRRSTEQITARGYFLQEEAAEAMRRELARGLATGVNPRDTARRMVAAVGGVFNGGLVRAMTIARTEQLDAYRNAAQAFELANSDMLVGWRWHATLGPRTCRSCLAQHGTLHDLDEPGPQDHPNGRCARVPETKDWGDIDPRLAGMSEPRPRLAPGDGEAWLAKQSAEVQEHILGKQGADAWRSGSWPSSAWSQKRQNPGWRDSYQAAKAPAVHPNPYSLPRQKTSETKLESLARTNPLMNSKNGYQANCTNCVVAFEHRLRGFEVTAAPNFTGRPAGAIADAWELAGGGKPQIWKLPGTGKNGLAAMASDASIPDGARGSIQAMWKRGNGWGHVWSWEKRGGKIVLSDPQNGQDDVAHYLDHVRSGTVQAIRTDNAQFHGTVKEWMAS